MNIKTAFLMTHFFSSVIAR